MVVTRGRDITVRGTPGDDRAIFGSNRFTAVLMGAGMCRLTGMGDLMGSFIGMAILLSVPVRIEAALC
jgi:hypothetical protein